jgi:hypothetical protein
MNDSSESPDLLKRPEAVIFLLIAALFVFWDAYLSLLDEANSTSLSSRQLAQRLGTTQKTIRRRKSQPDFSAWTQQLDPDGVAWTYCTGGMYAPRIYRHPT